MWYLRILIIPSSPTLDPAPTRSRYSWRWFNAGDWRSKKSTLLLINLIIPSLPNLDPARLHPFTPYYRCYWADHSLQEIKGVLYIYSLCPTKNNFYFIRGFPRLSPSAFGSIAYYLLFLFVSWGETERDALMTFILLRAHQNFFFFWQYHGARNNKRRLFVWRLRAFPLFTAARYSSILLLYHHQPTRYKKIRRWLYHTVKNWYYADDGRRCFFFSPNKIHRVFSHHQEHHTTKDIFIYAENFYAENFNMLDEFIGIE